MPGKSQTGRTGQWIVQGEGVSSGALAELVDQSVDIHEVRRVARDVVVLSMSDESAQQLQGEFGAHLVVERDADLEL